MARANQGKRHEAIMAGIGGKGVLLVGQFLAQAGMELYPYVTWSPTYYTLMRSGPSECTVILSETPIASPLLSLASTVIIFESSQFQDFVGRARPGGILLAESAGLPEVGRDDVRVVKIPATEAAVNLGSPLCANFVILGAYLGLTGALPAELIERQIDLRFPPQSPMQELNRRAFRYGLELVSSPGDSP